MERFLRILLTGTFFFLISHAFTQDRKADSLKAGLTGDHSDDQNIHLLNEIAAFYLDKQIDSAERYNTLALNFFQGSEGDTLYLRILEIRGSVLHEKSRYQDALSVHRQLLLLQSAVNDLEGVVETYNKLGAGYFYVDNLDSSLFFFRSALEIHLKSGNQEGISESYNNIGIVRMYQGKYPAAIENLLKSAKIDEERGDEADVAKVYNNIGLLYDDQDDYENAVKYYKKALEIRRRLDLTKGMYSALNNLGVTYKNQKKYEESLACLNEAAEIGRKLGYTKGLSLTYSNIGIVLTNLQKTREAITYHKKSLNIDLETADSLRIASSYVNLADAYRQLKEFSTALMYLNKGIRIMQKSHYLKNLAEAYRIRMEVLSDMGRYKEALEAYRTMTTLNDSLFNLEKTTQITEIETRYETEKKEKEILILKEKTAQQEKTQALAELKLANRKRWIIALSLSILVLFFFAAYLFQRRKRIDEAKRDAAIIRERELGLKAVIEGQEEERKRIAKDLHDGIGQQLGGLKLAWQALENILHKKIPEETENLKNLSHTLDEAATEVRTISHQMMPRVLNEAGLIPAVEDMLQKSLGNTPILYNFEHFDLDQRFPENVEISLYRIIQELISNIIRHSGATEVSVQLFRNDKKVVLIVEDNGVGFDARQKAEGIGLMNIKSRLNTINGEVNYNPSPGSGTVATIRIPIGISNSKTGG